MTRSVLFTAIMPFMATFAGCTVFPNPEPPRVMDLSLQGQSYHSTETQPHSVRVDTPYASEPFNGTQILAKPNAWEFRIYNDVRWRDAAPVLLRDVLIQALRESSGFTGVVSDTSPAETDWSLITELSAFQTESRPDGVHAVIRLHARILDNRSRNTLCAEGFSVHQKSDSPEIEQVVKGFSGAARELSESVSRWAVECAQTATQETDQATLPSGTTP